MFTIKIQVRTGNEFKTVDSGTTQTLDNESLDAIAKKGYSLSIVAKAGTPIPNGWAQSFNANGLITLPSGDMPLYRVKLLNTSSLASSLPELEPTPF